MKDKAQTILETAAREGVCNTGKRYLKRVPKDATTLIKIMKAWPEYIQEHPDSALAILRENMTDDLRNQLIAANIFIDYDGEATIGSDTSVIVMGDSRIEISITPYAATKLYFFNSSRAFISQADGSIIDIEAWNNSNVIISEKKSTISTVYIYDQAEVSGAKIIKRKDYQRGEIFNGKENDINKK